MTHVKLCCLLLCCGPVATPLLHARDEQDKPNAAAPRAVPQVQVVVNELPDVGVNFPEVKVMLAAKAMAAQRDQMAERLRPAVNRELAFIRRAVKLTDEQRQKISVDAEAALLELAGENDHIINGRVILRVDGAFVQPANANQGDLQSTIRQRAQQAADPHLTDAQRENLKAELQHRADAEKAAMIEDVLMQIDAHVRLSQSQYEQMKKTLSDKWQHSISLRFNSGQVFTVPAVPDELVLPFLSEIQQVAWKLANKAPSYTHFNQSNNIFDEPLWEAPAAKVNAAEKPEAEATYEEVEHGDQ